MVRVHFLLNFSTAPDCPLFGARLSSTLDCPRPIVRTPDCPPANRINNQRNKKQANYCVTLNVETNL